MGEKKCFSFKMVSIHCNKVQPENRSLHSACYVTENVWKFRRTLPHSCYLILHFKRPKAVVYRMHYFITLVTTSPSIKAGNDDPVWAGEVGAPVQLETIVHPLTAGATVPERESNSIYHQMLTKVHWIILGCSTEECSLLFTYTSIRRGYFLDFMKFGGNIIWYQRSVGKKENCYKMSKKRQIDI